MSYTLRGRLESRVAAALLPLLAAALVSTALRAWWPWELAILMLAVGLLCDAALYHRLVPYQPGWAALPLAVGELALVVGAAHLLGVGAPLGPALAFFWGAWAIAQVATHAALPLVRLTYAEDGGELGRLGAGMAAVAVAAVAFGGGAAVGAAPPTVRLSAGQHRGPLVLDRPQVVVGDPGAVVTGGIVISADGVRVRNVRVRGGETGILVENAEGVVLDGVQVEGARVDGIAARGSSVTIRDCVVRDLAPRHTQAIDISFAATLAESRVEHCRIEGGAEGVATQMAHVDVRDNVVRGTSLRAISLNEMSMGSVRRNVVRDAAGIGILCMDFSVCEVEENAVVRTRPDAASQVASRAGYAIVAHYGSLAYVRHNHLVGNARGVGAFVNSTVARAEQK
ncbi:MAG: right-handed parallel beta-helix repeat-containing protein [Thermoleophilia bacterium]|nr:right-handed parallel beta-helix repeat-containing protein [Thermoleophilia bacterium]